MIEQLLISGKLGDGCIVRKSSTAKAIIMFNTISMDYLIHKKVILEKNGIGTSNIHYGMSGYKKGRKIPRFSSHVDTRITKVSEMSILECINKLDKIGLIYLFLDDGSLHQKRRFGNLYCNSFKEDEVEALIQKIWELYPIKRCSKLFDKKKDGRVYPYITIKRDTMEAFLIDLQNFLNKYEIKDMFYKAGLPSTTISDESTFK